MSCLNSFYCWRSKFFQFSLSKRWYFHEQELAVLIWKDITPLKTIKSKMNRTPRKLICREQSYSACLILMSRKRVALVHWRLVKLCFNEFVVNHNLFSLLPHNGRDSIRSSLRTVLFLLGGLAVLIWFVERHQGMEYQKSQQEKSACTCIFKD